MEDTSKPINLIDVSPEINHGTFKWKDDTCGERFFEEFQKRVRNKIFTFDLRNSRQV